MRQRLGLAQARLTDPELLMLDEPTTGRDVDAARELRLEQVAGVHGALALAGAHDVVQFVDEKDDLALAAGDLLEEGLQPLLELAAKLGARHHAAEVHGNEPLVLQRVGHVPGDDAPRQPLGDGGLADAGLADEHGVVLGAARQHLQGPPDLLVTADDRVELALPRPRGEVGAVFLQGLVFALGVLVHDPLGAAHRRQRLLQGGGLDARILDQPRHLPGTAGQGQQHMLDGNILVLELLLLILGTGDQLAEFAG